MQLKTPEMRAPRRESCSGSFATGGTTGSTARPGGRIIKFCSQVWRFKISRAQQQYDHSDLMLAKRPASTVEGDEPQPRAT